MAATRSKGVNFDCAVGADERRAGRLRSMSQAAGRATAVRIQG
jgi:hypothetical protein